MAKKGGHRHKKAKDGHYHIGGHKYKKLIGSRAQVYHGTCYKTSGGLLKGSLKKNKHGRIVSVRVSNRAKRERRLAKAGYIPKKGQFKLFSKKRASY